MITKPIPAATNPSQTARAEIVLPSAIAKKLQSNLSELNVLPAIAMQAVKMSKDPECSMGEFSSLIERDVKLATDILRMANSVVFSGGSPVHSLHQAVVRLGFRHCKNLILSSSVSGLMKKLSLEEAWIRELLWRHSFLTGMLAVHLNRVLNTGFFGEEFTAGLIHDFGRTLFAFSLPGEFAAIDPLHFDEGDSILDYEKSKVEIDHCELGAWFARQNQLPETLYDVILYHHQPQLAGETRRLVALIAVADQIANALQRSETPDSFVPDSIPFLDVLESSGVTQARLKFDKKYKEIINNALQDASEMTRG